MWYQLSIICNVFWKDRDTYGVDDDPMLLIIITIITLEVNTLHPKHAYQLDIVDISSIITFRWMWYQLYVMYSRMIMIFMVFDDDPMLLIILAIITFH
jgi:hypothetical protein